MKGYNKLNDFDDLSSLAGITLKTLSLEDDGIDFKASFEKAMKARHLTFRETLLMVNPKEVVLYKIIGIFFYFYFTHPLRIYAID